MCGRGRRIAAGSRSTIHSGVIVMASKRAKRSIKLRDLKIRGITSDSAGRREAAAVRGGASSPVPRGTQSAPSQSKVIVSP
jgi:hypothetical protein